VRAASNPINGEARLMHDLAWALGLLQGAR
jgi:hypothetical protein